VFLTLIEIFAPFAAAEEDQEEEGDSADSDFDDPSADAPDEKQSDEEQQVRKDERSAAVRIPAFFFSALFHLFNQGPVFFFIFVFVPLFHHAEEAQENWLSRPQETEKIRR
jgi:hypothetical protein